LSADDETGALNGYGLAPREAAFIGSPRRTHAKNVGPEVQKFSMMVPETSS